jgi:hypothetical protein
MTKKPKSKKSYDEDDDGDDEVEPLELDESVEQEEPADVPNEPPPVSAELADVQQQAQRLTDAAAAIQNPPPLGRASESDQQVFSEEQKAGQEAVANAERAARAAADAAAEEKAGKAKKNG